MGNIMGDFHKENIFMSDDNGVMVFGYEIGRYANFYMAVPKGHFLYGNSDVVSPENGKYRGFNYNQGYWLIQYKVGYVTDDVVERLLEWYSNLMITESLYIKVSIDAIRDAIARFRGRDSNEYRVTVLRKLACWMDEACVGFVYRLSDWQVGFLKESSYNVYY